MEIAARREAEACLPRLRAGMLCPARSRLRTRELRGGAFRPQLAERMLVGGGNGRVVGFVEGHLDVADLSAMVPDGGDGASQAGQKYVGLKKGAQDRRLIVHHEQHRVLGVNGGGLSGMCLLVGSSVLFGFVAAAGVEARGLEPAIDEGHHEHHSADRDKDDGDGVEAMVCDIASIDDAGDCE